MAYKDPEATKKIRKDKIKNGICLACKAPATIKYYCQEHLDKRTISQRNSYEKKKLDPEWCKQQRDYAKMMREENKNKHKERYLKKKYNLTLEERSKLLKSQNNCCAICGYNKLENENKFPVIDHCHNTGKIRGILCANCNIGLGMFKDEIDLLEKAISYLSKIK